MFDKKGSIIFYKQAVDEDALMEAVLERGPMMSAIRKPSGR